MLQRIQKITLFAFIFISYSSFSQQTLPLYEKNDQGDILLMRIDSLPKNIKKQFDTVSILSENRICYGKIKKLKLITQKECCTNPDPKFLLASLKMNEKYCNGGIFINGKVDVGKILNYDSLKIKINLFEMANDNFEKPLISREAITRYRWAATEIDGKKDVFLQAKSKNNSKEDQIDTYKVPLKNCIHIKTDSVDFFYCETDTANNYRIKNLNWYNEKVYWSLFYVNKKLIYVTPDFSKTTIGGHSPFHHKEQKLSAIYNAKGVAFYYFSPGYVIYYKNGTWEIKNREPVKYYGKCDC